MRIQKFTSILILLGFTTIPQLAQETVRRLTQEEAVKAALTKPQPEYPPVARQLRIQGRIEVEMSIDSAGAVDNVKVISGNPALTGNAVNTLKHWRFEPILSGGKAVRAVAVMGFSFRL